MSAEAIAAYVEEFLPEDDPLLAARRNAAQVGGAPPVSPAVGATLRFIAAALSAKAVVEIGTGCGTSGIWLLRGMRRDCVLTSVDVEPEHQRLARKAFTDAGFASEPVPADQRQGRSTSCPVSPTALTTWCSATPTSRSTPDYLTAALRLLRPGGVVAFDNALWDGRVTDPGRTDPETSAIRELTEQVRQDERLVPLLLPVGDGLLAAVKRG